MAQLELDNMEYSTDALAQAAYVTNSSSSSVKTIAQESSNTDTGIVCTNTGNSGFAQGFKTTTTNTITKFTVQMRRGASINPTGVLTAYIYSDNGSGKPNSALATFSNMNLTDVSTSNTLYDFTGTFVPTVGVQYHIVVICTGETVYTVLYYPSMSSQPYTDGTVSYFEAGGSWDNQVYDLYFMIYQTVFNLQSHFESTLKTQGSYSLKGIAVITDSLNKTLTKTLSPVSNLTSVKNLKFDIRSSRTGSNIKIELHDSIDTYKKLVCQFNGVDGATTYTAETGQTITFAGTAQLDTAQKKFGLSSLLLDGNSDYVTVPDNDNWTFGAGDFTIDCWVRFNSTDGNQVLVAQYASDFNYWFLRKDADNKIRFRAVERIVFDDFVRGDFITTSVPTLNPDTWYHIAFIRNGSNALLFIDGVSQALSTLTAWGTLQDIADVLVIGRLDATNGLYFNGWIDEVRISKGIARWTSNFTPPTTSDGITELTPNIISANTFQTVNWNLSAIADADKDSINNIIITILNADAENTFYLDNFNIAQTIDCFGWIT